MYNTSLESDIKIMSQYQITAEENLFIKLLFYVQEHERESFDIFLNECKHDNISGIIQNLVDKNILLKSSLPKNNIIKIENIEFNKNFLKGYMKYSYDMGMELFMAYPTTLFINGVSYSAKNIAKKFDSLEQFAFTYARSIGFNEEKHREVMSILEWAKENDLLHFGICEFIISQKWIEYKELKEKGGGTFDTTELL